MVTYVANNYYLFIYYLCISGILKDGWTSIFVFHGVFKDLGAWLLSDQISPSERSTSALGLL